MVWNPGNIALMDIGSVL